MLNLKKRTHLIVLTILVLGSVGTILSAFYLSVYQDFVVYRTSYGFPFGWHGHVISGGPVIEPFIDADWFSAESLLLDIAFWFAISTIMIITTIKSVSIVRKKKIQKN
jgi:hypothetical protein